MVWTKEELKAYYDFHMKRSKPKSFSEENELEELQKMDAQDIRQEQTKQSNWLYE